MNTIYKQAGYTHMITWNEFHKYIGMMVEKRFPTTADALQKHLANFKRENIVPLVEVL
jgi:hypothetical protein